MSKLKMFFCRHKFEVLSLNVYQRLNWWGEPNGNHQINYTAECTKCDKMVSEEMQLASVSGLNYKKAEELILKKIDK
jgi:hypothetical protein